MSIVTVLHCLCIQQLVTRFPHLKFQSHLQLSAHIMWPWTSVYVVCKWDLDFAVYSCMQVSLLEYTNRLAQKILTKLSEANITVRWHQNYLHLDYSRSFTNLTQNGSIHKLKIAFKLTAGTLLSYKHKLISPLSQYLVHKPS